MNKEFKPPFISTGFIDNKKIMKNRFSNIFGESRKKNGITILLAAALIGLTAGSFVSCKSNSDLTTQKIQNEESSEMSVKTFDEIISELLISDSKGKYLEGECAAEGHKIFGIEETDDKGTIYAAVMSGEYGFQDGNFVKVSGSGVIPVAITFAGTDGSYSDFEIKYPIDGAYYEKSIREMFPKKYVDEALGAEKYYDELKRQECKYAENYLKSINRQAKIGNYGDFEHILPDMDTNCSNTLMNEFSEYPYWIGNQEKIENGVRIIYSKDWKSAGGGDGTVTYRKTDFESGKVLEESIIEIKNGKMKILE